MKFILYYPKKEKHNINNIDESVVLDELYFNLANIASENEILDSGNKDLIQIMNKIIEENKLKKNEYMSFIRN